MPLPPARTQATRAELRAAAGARKTLECRTGGPDVLQQLLGLGQRLLRSAQVDVDAQESLGHRPLEQWRVSSRDEAGAEAREEL